MLPRALPVVHTSHLHGVLTSRLDLTVTAVSVILPAFNPDEGLLRLALDSVISQTLSDWDLVVIDDGSYVPLLWCRTIDPRISVIRQRNTGLARARNRGINETRAPLLAFLDADDIWMPTKLERQVERLSTSPDSVLCATNFEHIDADGAYLSGGYNGHNSSYVDLLGGCGICVSTVVVRRPALEVCGAFDPAYSTASDWELWLRLALVGTFANIDDVLAQYRLHASNMSRDYALTYSEAVRFLSAHRTQCESQGRHNCALAASDGMRTLRQRSARQAIDEARRSSREGRLLETGRHLYKAAVFNPPTTARDLWGMLTRTRGNA